MGVREMDRFPEQWRMGLPTNLRCHAVTAGADSPVSRLCTGRIRA